MVYEFWPPFRGNPHPWTAAHLEVSLCTITLSEWGRLWECLSDRYLHLPVRRAWFKSRLNKNSSLQEFVFSRPLQICQQDVFSTTMNASIDVPEPLTKKIHLNCYWILLWYRADMICSLLKRGAETPVCRLTVFQQTQKCCLQFRSAGDQLIFNLWYSMRSFRRHPHCRCQDTHPQKFCDFAGSITAQQYRMRQAVRSMTKELDEIFQDGNWLRSEYQEAWSSHPSY